MEGGSLIKVLKSSFVSRYVNSLFVLGHDNRSRVRFVYILSASSIFLSLSSFYTTTDGLAQVVHIAIAVSLALGIQGLLFAASWRIGVVRGTSNFPFYLKIIYLISLIFSVVFSFISFFNTLYPQNQQNYDELNEVRSSAYEINEQATAIASQIVQKDIDSIKLQFNNWFTTASNSFDLNIVESLQPYRSKKLVYDELVNRANLELNEGYGPGSPGGGDGILHRRYRREADLYYRNEVAIYGTRIIELDSLHTQFVSLSKEFVESKSPMTAGKLFSIENAYRGVLARLDTRIRNNPVPKSITSKVAKYDPLLVFLNRDLARYDTIGSVKRIKIELFDRINAIPNFKGISRSSFIDAANEIDRFSGENMHYFAKSLYQLYNLNWLAIISFILALGIDGLVLACGILGTSPNSILNLKNTEELFSQSDNAVQSAFLSLSILKSTTYGDQIKKFQLLLEPSFEEAESNGIPATISVIKIKSNDLTGVVGLLISLNLIFVPEGLSDSQLTDQNENLGVSLKLSLWLNEQLLKHSEANSSFKDFIKITKS
jgi:hypothetical protein